jgi:hypothetical protein
MQLFDLSCVERADLDGRNGQHQRNGRFHLRLDSHKQR